ncbi:hypothetical protein KP509_13G048000 [Ceratopteris richardii]|nr:hypothetical protein KP509_13G048000 [Ceratopteris richardii]
MRCYSQEFDDLAELPEYSQISSSVSKVDNTSSACDIIYNYDIESIGFDVSQFWSLEHNCNNSDIESGEILSKLLSADCCIDIPSTDALTMNDCLFGNKESSSIDMAVKQREGSISGDNNVMIYDQQARISEDYSQITSVHISELSNFEEPLNGSLITDSKDQDNASGESYTDRQSSAVEVRCFPSVLVDELNSSEVELIDIPPLIYDETGSLLGKFLPQYEPMFFVNKATRFPEVNHLEEEREIFDERDFLLIDHGMPEEGGLENYGMLQFPWDPFSKNSLEISTTEATRTTSIKMKELIHVQAQDGVDKWPTRHASIGEASHMYTSIRSDSPKRESSSFCLLDRTIGKAKNIRKRRLRRATPFQTLKSLLRIVDGTPAITNQTRCDEDGLRSPFTGTGGSVLGKMSKKKIPVSFDCNKEAEKLSGSCTASSFSNSGSVYSSFRQSHTRCTKSEKEILQFHSDDQVSKRVPEDVSGRKSENQVRNRTEPARKPPRCSSLLPEHAVSILRKWFEDHISYPFADKEEKLLLVSQTGLTLTQVDNWLSNYRHRLKLRKSDYDGTLLRPNKAKIRH